jgi:hypothetical protein
MESVMNNLNWEQEHQRFMTIAYDRTQKAAKRAFWGWHESKRPDAIAECIGKMWDQWSRLLLRGRNPEPMTSALIKYAILWVRYDRKIGGRARNLDVFDFRANMNRQMLSDQGEAAPSERSSAENSWINWDLQAGDDPCQLAAALEQTGVTLAQWCDC